MDCLIFRILEITVNWLNKYVKIIVLNLTKKELKIRKNHNKYKNKIPNKSIKLLIQIILILKSKKFQKSKQRIIFIIITVAKI